VDRLVRLAEEVEVLETSWSGDVCGATADVRFIAPVLDEELDWVPGWLAEIAFKLILNYRIGLHYN